MTKPNNFDAIALAFLLTIIALCFAATSGSIQWMDNGMFLADASKGVYFPPELGAQSHPLYHAVSALVSAAFGSSGLALLNAVLLLPIAWLVVRITRSLGGSLNAGLFAACTACLVHSVFWISTKVEVYTLNMLLILACYWVVFDVSLRISASARMLLLGMFTGLGLAVHQLTLLCVAPLYLYVASTYGAASLVSVAGALAGLAPCYPGFIAELGRGHGALTVVREFLTNASPASDHPAGYEGSFGRIDHMWQSKSFVAITLLSLLGPQVIGIWRPRDERERALWRAAILNLVFAVSYDQADRFTFILPGAALLAILAWLRIDRAFALDTRRMWLSAASVAAAPIALMLAYSAAKAGVVHLPKNAHALPFRDDVKYFMVPYLHDDSAVEFARAYEKQVPGGAVVFGDWTPIAALQSAQADGVFMGRTLLDCKEYPAWSLGAHAQPAYVVRLEAGCEDVGISAAEPMAIGYRIPTRVAAATVQQ